MFSPVVSISCLVSRVVLMTVASAGCEFPSWFRRMRTDTDESVVFRDGRVVPADPVAERSTPNSQRT